MVVGVAWALAAGGFAIIIPVERAAVAGGKGGRVGQAFALHGVCALSGSVIGAAGAGALYSAAGWPFACVAAGFVGLAAMPVVPFALRAASGSMSQRSAVDGDPS